MLIETQTATINAAFLQEIKDDDVELDVLLKRLFETCSIQSAADVAPRRLAGLLEEVRDQLAMHFALEEAYGYLDEPVCVAPHLSEKVISLRNQHGELYEEISSIAEIGADICATSQRYPVRLRLIRDLFERIRNFRRNLLEHESAETELILHAYHVDIGGSG